VPERGTAAGFEEQRARAILQSERTRMLILAGLSGAVVVIFPLAFLVLTLRQDPGARVLGTEWALQVLAVFVLLTGYELTVRRVVGRRLAQGQSLPRPLRFVNAFVETSVPSLSIVIGSRQVDPIYPLQSAAAYLYPVFIILSTLRLDFRLSLFTGCVAAIEYVVLSAMFAGSSRVAAGTLFVLPPCYAAKGVALILAGVAAGFVADQITRRVTAAFRALDERQRVVSAFGQQVSPAIVDALLERGGDIPSTRTFVCVLFMDIRDFSRTVEKKTPEEFVGHQNAVFGAAIGIVDRHHGVINQFLGDGFMATFGAPVSTGRDCEHALTAARELLAAVQALSESGRIPPTRIGIGLHAGEAVSGNIRYAGTAAELDQRQRGDPRRADRAAQQGVWLAAPRVGGSAARGRRARRPVAGPGPGQGPRRADRDLSPGLMSCRAVSRGPRCPRSRRESAARRGPARRRGCSRDRAARETPRRAPRRRASDSPSA